MSKSFDQQRVEFRGLAAQSLKPVSRDEAGKLTQFSNRTFQFSTDAIERMDDARDVVAAALAKKAQ